MRQLKRILYILLYFASPLPPILAVYNIDPGMYSQPSSLMAMAASTSAFTWLVLQFILASRPRFAEKHFGMDRLYRLHSYMALVAVALVLIHRTVQEPMWEGSVNARLGDASWFTFIAVVISGFLFLADSAITRWRPVAKVKKALSALWLTKYQTHAVFHYMVVVAYALMLLHVLKSGAVQSSPTAKALLLGYWITGAGFYVYYRLIRRIILERRAFAISDVLQEGPGTWTLRLVPRNPGQVPALVYKPGQFGFLRVFGKGKGMKAESHPFSLTSTPTDTAGITLTIKELGDYTAGIGKVQPGTKALFDGPYGAFSYLDHPQDSVVVLIAGGVGITPALSMLRHMGQTDFERHVALFWGANSTAELAWLEELKGLQRNMPNFTLVPVVWLDDAWTGERGFVDREKLERHLAPYLNGLAGGPDAMGYYVCGPGPMLKAVLASLKDMGVEGSSIRHERFSL